MARDGFLFLFFFLMHSPGSQAAHDDADTPGRVPSLKSATKRIVISEPDEEQLRQHLAGRDVSPGLGRFLKNMINGRKWARKINVPSTHDDLAAVLVFTSELKEHGLEISSELHVFFADRIFIEKWQVRGEQTSSAPTEMFRSVEIQKVRLEKNEVRVILKMLGEGDEKMATRTFDFSGDNPGVRTVANPFL